MLNLNRANLADEPINIELNAAIERAAAATAELPRPYLGASIVGDECARKIQYEWWCKPLLASRVRSIFARGHFFEARTREQLIAAAFEFAPESELAFSAAKGDLQGHADGLILAGPDLPNVHLDYPALWECKALNAKKKPLRTRLLPCHRKR
jgi:hypothetical protein